ncbi:MAG: phosphoenolpyruvate--protein phosphotransferase [Chlamydiota bacterium]
MEKLVEELSLTGTSIGSGIATGELFFLEAFDENAVPEFSISIDEVESEIERYREAIFSSREGLYDLQRFLIQEGSTKVTSIVDTHIQMLEDPFLTTFMEKRIREMGKNTEAVFCSVMREYEKKFSQIGDQFFQQRLTDVKDVAQRVLKNLNPKKKLNKVEIPQHAIIFTKELIPSKVAELSPKHVRGFITEIGGATSHAALIACSKGFPYITDIEIGLLYPYCGSQVIIDGEAGKIFVNPDFKTTEKYKALENKHHQVKLRAQEEGPRGAITRDRCEVTMLANVESLGDLDLLQNYGAEGIGLFRSEFFFLTKELGSLSEEAQYHLYRDVIVRAKGIPVTFRVFDVGGDKGQVDSYPPEPNPALGCRAVRFLLRNREIFVTQLRALLRASYAGSINILLPLVSDFEEIRQVKELMQQVKLTLQEEGYPIADAIDFGIMIEVPAMVIMADLIAQEVDFISIGTNDLTQYALAADRSNRKAHSFYRPHHPAIIRMIHHIITTVSPYCKPVSLCGEIASDLLVVPLLLGVGVRQFSCSPRFIPQVRQMLEAVSLEEATAVAEKALKLTTESGVETLLTQHYKEIAASIEQGF